MCGRENYRWVEGDLKSVRMNCCDDNEGEGVAEVRLNLNP